MIAWLIVGVLLGYLAGRFVEVYRRLDDDVARLLDREKRATW